MLIDTPSLENRVTLDRDGEPQVTYTLSPGDKERFRRGVAEAVRIMFLAGAKEVYLPTTEDILGNDVNQTELQPVILTTIQQAEAVATKLQFIPNRTIVTSAHMQATNKMGADARDSVVSKDFRVWGTEGLYSRRSKVLRADGPPSRFTQGERVIGHAELSEVKRRRLLRFLWTGRPFSQTWEPNQRSTIARTSTEWLYNIIFALGTT